MTVTGEVRGSNRDAASPPPVDTRPVEFWPTAAIRAALENDAHGPLKSALNPYIFLSENVDTRAVLENDVHGPQDPTDILICFTLLIVHTRAVLENDVHGPLQPA